MKQKPVVEKVFKRKEPATVPTLLTFQNGSVEAVSKENTIYCQVENKGTKTKDALVVSGGHIYSGPIDPKSNEQLTDTYIVVRSKTTQKVRIIPIEQAQLNNTIYQKLDKESQQKAISKEYASKKLLTQFGGRKATRFVENREKMKVNVDVVREEVETTVKEANLLDDTVEVNFNNPEFLKSISPKCNFEAKVVSEVYDVEDIVSCELLERMAEEAKVVYATAPQNLPIKSEYLLDCIKRIQAKETQSAKDFRNIKIIIYMDALQSLISTHTRNMKTLELSGITDKVENDIRERFADPSAVKSFTRSSFSSEKALTHFIVLALLISDNYEVDAELISRTLHVSKKKIITYAHVVNAQPKARTDVLSLKLPSKMKPLSSGGRFRKKK